MLISFFKYLKKHSYKILKSLAEFFAYPLFKYFKKAYLQNLEKSSTIFLLIPFFKYLKKHTYKILKNLAPFFADTLFQIFKHLRQFFKYLKKACLQISKYLFHTDNNFKGNNLHKNHYTNNSHKNHHKHKAKYIIIVCIPKIIIKKFLLFYKKKFIII